MSDKIDVLAVMDSAKERAFDDACQYKYDPKDGRDLQEARNAVAELESIASRILYAHKNHGNGAAMGEAILCGMYAGLLEHALARFGGGK